MTNEAEAHAKLTDELDRLRVVADTFGQAFADAAARVRRFVDAWEGGFGGIDTVASIWTGHMVGNMPEGAAITVADLRALIDVDPRPKVDGDIGWHRRHALAEAARVQARGPYHPLDEEE